MMDTPSPKHLRAAVIEPRSMGHVPTNSPNGAQGVANRRSQGERNALATRRVRSGRRARQELPIDLGARRDALAGPPTAQKDA